MLRSAIQIQGHGRRFLSITPLYTAKATATGGRAGSVKSSDGTLNLMLALPTGLGGPGTAGKTNPEQLFAAGYSSCFQGALGVAARNAKVSLAADTTVTGQVHIGKRAGSDALLLEVELKVTAPSFSDKAKLLELTKAAHQICPYSNATRGNIEVHLSVA